MRISTSLRWLVVAVSAAMLLAVVAACAGETVEVPGETVVVEKEVIKEVQVPGETVVVEKEVIKEVMVPGETVTKEVVKEVMVPGETVVVEKEVVKTVEVPGETVVVEKVMVKEVQGKKYVTDPSTGKVVSAPEYGGTMTIGSILETALIDSHTLGHSSMHFVSGVLEKLSMVDWAIDRDVFDIRTFALQDNSVLIGQLAESWDMPDDTTIIFNIRKGVHWHDKAPMNGRELTAKDIEYNFNRWLAMGEFSGAERSPYTRILGIPEWESITATDDSTVVFKLKEPHIWALTYVHWSEIAWIYPPEVIQEHGDANDWKNLVGTGPFMLTDVVEGSSHTLTKNPNYWGYDEKYPQNRLPYIDQLKVLAIPENTTRISALRTGLIDYVGWAGWAGISSVDTAARLKETNPEIVQFPLWFGSNNVISVTAQRPPFDDIRVRQAMQKAIDLKTISTTYYKGVAKWEPAGPNVAAGYHTPFEDWPEELKQEYTYDPDGAEALLDAAGYKRGADGIRFKTEIKVPDWQDIGYAELVVEYFGDIGIDLEVQQVLFAEYEGLIRTTPFELIIWVGGAPTVEESLVAVHSKYAKDDYPKFGLNWPKNDPDYDRIITDMRAAASVQEWQRFFREADDYVIEKHWRKWPKNDPDYDRIIDSETCELLPALWLAEEWQRFFREADDYVIEKHWLKNMGSRAAFCSGSPAVDHRL